LLAVFLSILIDYLPKVSYIYLEFEIKRGETMNQQQEALKAYIGLLRTSHRLEQLAKQDVTCYDLNITEFSVLELLLHKGPQTIQKIKEKILIASSSTTYVIDQLHKKGYVTRTPSEKDRRITYVELTEAGLIEEIFPTHAKRIAEAFEQLSSEELTLLQKTLRKITNETK